jgi:hypothetical protein
MPDFNHRTAGGSGKGSVIRLEPVDHPHLESTYHFSLEDARAAANHQSSHFGGFKYNLHVDGKPVQLSALARGVEMTETAAAYNKSPRGR